uniref:G-protein alpha subunit n=1 Tax=Bursaphelenchus xylophilus TaxID=6326 RepID=A0A1I7RMW3_BURXY
MWKSKKKTLRSAVARTSSIAQAVTPMSTMNVENPTRYVDAKSPNPELYVKAAEISKKIDDQLVKDHMAMEKVIKLLLLGPSESGKSTVLKQMRIIHCNGFSTEELWARRPLIFLNVLQSIAQLIHGIEKLGMILPKELQRDADLIFQALTDEKNIENQIPKNVYFAIKRLWAEETIQKAYERRNEYHVIDCAKYFLDDIDRLQSSSYVPTVSDVLYARQETIGVSEIRYSYKEMEFRIFDVGGQKTERRKWIHLFDNVNAIFFIAAISEYDQKMREDTETNRLHDAIELFKNIGNNPIFARVQLILFLNKQDLFAEKINKIPLSMCFPTYQLFCERLKALRPQEYDDKNEFKKAALYITRKFEKQINDKQKMIYTHLTCATDTSHLSFLMNSIIDYIISENFKQTGVL